MRKIILFVLLLPGMLLAQVPQAFDFQGVARDASGNPVVSQTIGLRLSIIAGSPAGSTMYAENQSATTSPFGLFNVQIGNGTVISGSFPAIDWASDAHYLKVEYDPAGGSSYIEMGTTQLLSVPYALHARSVDCFSVSLLGDTLRQGNGCFVVIPGISAANGGCLDLDGDGVYDHIGCNDPIDCDDNDPTVYPGALEICGDGKDNDCDDLIDNNPDVTAHVTWYLDADGDGYGDAAISQVTCAQPAGYVENGDDCDDSDALRFPGQGCSLVCSSADQDHIDQNQEFYLQVVEGFFEYCLNENNLNIEAALACLQFNLEQEFTGLITPGCHGCAVERMECWITNCLSNCIGGSTSEACVSCLQAQCTPAFINCLGLTDADADGWASGSDCDDSDPTRYPGAPELCDGIDNNCDGQVDEGVIVAWYPDLDGDGYGDMNATPTMDCDAPGPGFVGNAFDCDDSDPTVFPYQGCPGFDCGFAYGQNWGTCGFGLCENGVCVPCFDNDGDGFTDCDGDCDDNDPTVFPGAPELCDGIDNDCDGLVDEDVDLSTDLDNCGGCGIVCPPGYSCSSGVCICPPAGTACNDGDPCTINDVFDGACNCVGTPLNCPPGEICYQNGCIPDTDTDGDGVPDAIECPDFPNCPDTNADGTPDYQDIDDDGDGVYTAFELGSNYSQGQGAQDTDGDGIPDYLDPDDDGDGIPTAFELGGSYDPASYSGAQDTDGDGVADFLDPDDDGDGIPTSVECSAWPGCPDSNGDGIPDYLDPSSSTCTDADADGFFAEPGCGTPVDCNDTDPTVFPGANEVCDGIDNNCDGLIDEADPAVIAFIWYADADADGYGDPASSVLACSPPAGYVSDNSDCDDNDPSTHPGANEFCDGIDNNCDGVADEGDVCEPCTPGQVEPCGSNIGACTQGTRTCTAQGIWGACVGGNGPSTEICGDGIDNDCDGLIDEGFDLDSDVNHCGGCGNSCVFPNAISGCTGGQCVIVECEAGYADCDGNVINGCETILVDPNNCGGCGISCPPGFVCTGGVCSQICFDNDGDGFTDCDGDCDDNDPTVFPGAPELCDGKDNDCNGLVDENFDLSTDLDNCGGCGIVCPPGYSCSSGVCICPPAGTACNDGDPCTINDVFDGACNCVGTPLNCPPGEICYQNGCIPDTDTDGDGVPDAIECPGSTNCPDTNADGTPDYQDIDDDGDGVYTAFELGSNYSQGQGAQDSDGDGIPDYLDPDDDGDGIPTTFELGGSYNAASNTFALDTDANGIPDYLDPDDDGDGIPTSVECSAWPGCPDSNGDGIPDYLDPSNSFCTDADADGFFAEPGCGTPVDCDDNDPTVFPGANEVCDGIDNNCDGLIDEADPAVIAFIWYADADADGYGDPASSVLACSPPAGYVSDNSDCDDNDPSTHPGANEFCDGIDNNCDGVADEGDVCEPCTPGQVEPCGSNIGACTQGTRTCTAQGIWGACVGGNGPSTEICGDGIDNDCDGLIDEGFDLNSDVNNCGGCGNSCVFPNAISGCTGGQCVIVECEAGYADCDGNVINGCETIIGDLDNCGGCGIICPSPPNSSAYCSDGVCGFFCDPDYADCDGDPMNGCEIDLMTDPNNCGTCGNSCVFPNAISGCTNGQCVIVSCDAGYADCDGNVINGCETNMADVSNCGNCGVVCPSLPNSSAYCTAGVCGFFCDPGYADCDGDPMNGCEINLDTDLNNCGGCGISCPPGFACTSGICIQICFDNDGDGWTDCDGDCDDTNPQIYPGAPEICDGIDNDCDGLVDEENVCDPCTGPDVCFIDGQCYASGESDPTAYCRVCEPLNSTDSWSFRAQGVVCIQGDDCTFDSVCNGMGGECTPVYRPAGTPCDDGDPTTINDACDGLGNCSGTP